MTIYRVPMGHLLFGGLTTIDLVQYAQTLPASGQKATADESSLDVGGPAANAAITAAILGSTTELHTVLGVGPMTLFAKENLQRHGVAAVCHDHRVDLPMASIWVDGSGERTVLSTDNKRSSVVADKDQIRLDHVAAVLLDGHYPDLQVAIARAAVGAGVPIVLDCGRWRPVYAELLPVAADVIMTGSFRPPGMEALSTAEAMRVVYETHRPAQCAASRGSQSILVVDEAGSSEVPVAEVETVDTLGAGDVLHGAYVHYRYSEGLDERVALGRAALLASDSCRKRGLRGIAGSEEGR